jgi:hypothetical protein
MAGSAGAAAHLARAPQVSLQALAPKTPASRPDLGSYGSIGIDQVAAAA